MISKGLAEQGLNMQAVFDLAGLPDALGAALQPHMDQHGYRQLLLFANGGKQLWASIKRTGFQSNDPVDDFSKQLIGDFMAREHADCQYLLLYPGANPLSTVVPLQRLGALAGWHHASPMGIGINAQWGLWFAYRLVLLADTDFPVSTSIPSESPCDACSDKPCIGACPAGALKAMSFNGKACAAHRLVASSSCSETCLSRLACPVKPEHRYSDEQLNHHYRRSLIHLSI